MIHANRAGRDKVVRASTAAAAAVLAMLLVAGQARAGVTTLFSGPGAPGDGWLLACSLNEEFDGADLDTSIWTARTQDRGTTGGGVTWGWDAANVWLDSGQLVIRTQDDGDGTYSSGNAWTKDKWYQTYGYFEAKIDPPPPNNGHQAAFWMTAQDGGHFVVGDDGRDGAEIDITETKDGDDHYYANVNWDGYGAQHRSSGQQVTASGIHVGSHTFGLLWDADTLKYYYDGTLKRTYGGVGVPRVAEVLQASVGILDWCDGDIRTPNDPLPQYTYFDYVRAWERLETLTVDDAGAEITYVGTWNPDEATESDYLETMTQGEQAGEYVEFTFVGAGVDVFVRRGSCGGIVDFYLDGELVADDVDTYNATQDFQCLLFSQDGLDVVSHTLRIEVTGTKNPSSNGTLLMLDGIEHASVPEPASAALVLLGLPLVALRRRRGK